MSSELEDNGEILPADVLPRKDLLGRPRKRENATTLTVSISRADKELVKMYAYRHSLSVSDLIHMWINEKCKF